MLSVSEHSTLQKTRIFLVFFIVIQFLHSYSFGEEATQFKLTFLMPERYNRQQKKLNINAQMSGNLCEKQFLNWKGCAYWKRNVQLSQLPVWGFMCYEYRFT